MRLWLVALGLLPILMVGSGPGAVASTKPTPPHNGLIALSSSQGIRLVDAESAKAWTVPGTVEMGNSAWSPDGKVLAAERWNDGQASVYAITPDGKERKLVLENAYAPSWSPDGKQLVVIRSSGEISVLAIVDVESGEVRQIALDQGLEADGVSEAAWSPDGKWIAFTHWDGAVRLLSPNGDVDRMQKVADQGQNLAWSPDGSMLAFDAVDPVRHEQYIEVVDVSAGTRLTLSPREVASAPAWSPDGTQLAFLAARPMPETAHGCGGEMPTDLWTMAIAGTRPKLVEKNVWGQPSWGSYEPETKPTT